MDLYATTMQLVHVGGGDAFDLACRRAMEWAWRVNDDLPDLRNDPNGRRSDGDGETATTVAWSSVASRESRALEIRLQHPDSKDSTLHWQATTTVTEVEGATRMTLRLQLGATVHILQPWQISLRAPAIVLKMMQAPLLAYAGSLELSANAQVIEETGISSLVKDQLRAEGRALPLLIAASEVDDRFIQVLDRALAGLVQVVRLLDQEAEVSLSKRLKTSGYTVPRGGLRLFWPGFGLDGKSPRHPYWTAAQLRAGGRKKGPSVLGQLINMLAPISTGRVPIDAGFLRARREWLREQMESQRKRDEAVRQRARRQRQDAQRVMREARELAHGTEARHLQDQLSDVEARLVLVEQEREDARTAAEAAKENEFQSIQEAVDYSDRLEKAEEENADLRKNIRTLSEFRHLDEEESDGDEGALPEALESWGEVAAHLSELEGPGFHLTDNAYTCADSKSRYPSPGTMWNALRALEQVGRAYNEMGADLGGRFDKFASEQAGITVALQDHSYENSWFEYEGEWYQRVPHVKVDDAKSPNEVGRIYFALDSEGKRVIVDWFGTKPDRPQTKRIA